MLTSLEVVGLRKGFGGPLVLDGLDLSVKPGSFTAVLGPSGSGKTTLLRVVAGFERADAGSVRLGSIRVDDGRDCFVPADRRHIGYVPQEGALFPHLTVAANVGFGLPRRRRRGPEVSALLEMVGLGGMDRRYPHELSGGQQQRVALARALAIGPGLVLLDEPFSSLDAGMRASVRADVQGVLRRAGTTAVLVTHDQDEALSMADQVAVIRDGRIGQVDSPQALYGRPVDPALAQFVGAANLIPGVVEGASVVTPVGALGLAAGCVGLHGGDRALVLVRPEQLELNGDGREALTGEVRGYEYFGHDGVVRVRPDDEACDDLVVRVHGAVAWHRGARVGIRARGPVLAWPARPGAPITGGSRGPGTAAGPVEAVGDDPSPVTSA